MQTFEETPPEEIEPVIRAQLSEEVELKAQRLLTEQLAAPPRFRVLSLSEPRRLAGNLGVRRDPLTEAQLRARVYHCHRAQSGLWCALAVLGGQLGNEGDRSSHDRRVRLRLEPGCRGRLHCARSVHGSAYLVGRGLCLWLRTATRAGRIRGRADRALWWTAVEYADGHGPDSREDARRVSS